MSRFIIRHPSGYTAKIALALTICLCMNARTEAQYPAAFDRDAVRDASGAPVIAVLSADMAPYREALAGLRDILGADVPSFILPYQQPLITPATKVVITFGIKALQLDYPASVAVVHTLAPAIRDYDSLRKSGLSVHIAMTPTAKVLIARLKTIQPGLKRLGIIWAGESVDFSIAALRIEAENNGIALSAFRAAVPDDVPGVLRSINRQIDALWLPLDPALLTAQSFEVIKEYALGNNMPLYVPTEKLVEAGAAASISTSFADIGRTAAGAAKKILNSEKIEDAVYPAQVETAINLVTAERIDFRFTDQVLKEAAGNIIR